MGCLLLPHLFTFPYPYPPPPPTKRYVPIHHSCFEFEFESESPTLHIQKSKPKPNSRPSSWVPPPILQSHFFRLPIPQKRPNTLDASLSLLLLFSWELRGLGPSRYTTASYPEIINLNSIRADNLHR
ncbi:hypothetical protein NXS19_013870 [Fusarium pseudograminearum]|nr:hypothetical protein NXS19_013870 [Fusarium pseudograminearum]